MGIFSFRIRGLGRRLIGRQSWDPTGFTGLSRCYRHSMLSPAPFTNRLRTISVSPPLWLESESALIRILVVDDNPAVRHYLRAILEQQSSWQVCGEARTGAEALDQVQQAPPDVVLLDFQMPDLNGLEVAREIGRLSPSTPILMVTVHMSNQLAAAARAVGVRGACAKSDVGSIVEAVETLLQEKMYFPKTMSVTG